MRFCRFSQPRFLCSDFKKKCRFSLPVPIRFWRNHRFMMPFFGYLAAFPNGFWPLSQTRFSVPVFEPHSKEYDDDKVSGFYLVNRLWSALFESCTSYFTYYLLLIHIFQLLVTFSDNTLMFRAVERHTTLSNGLHRVQAHHRMMRTKTTMMMTMRMMTTVSWIFWNMCLI